MAEKGESKQDISNLYFESYSYREWLKKALLKEKELKRKSILLLGSVKSEFLDALKRLSKDVTYIQDEKQLQAHYQNLNEEANQFDFIIMFYHPQPGKECIDDKVFQVINKLLEENGLFLLDVYLVQDRKQDEYTLSYEQQNYSIPTISRLKKKDLKSFVMRYISSLNDNNTLPKIDNKDIKRYIFHCHRRLPNIIIIKGPSFAGKTILAEQLDTGDNQVIKTDDILSKMVRQNEVMALIEPLDKCYLTAQGATPEVHALLDMIKNNNQECIDYLVSSIIDSINYKKSLIILEGNALTPIVIDNIKNKIGKNAFIWETSRL